MNLPKALRELMARALSPWTRPMPPILPAPRGFADKFGGNYGPRDGE